MSTGSFSDTGTSVIGNTDNWVHVGGIGLPVGRNPTSGGPTYALITSIGAYVSGRGATRTIQLGFENAGVGSAFTVSPGSSAADTGAQASSLVVNGGTDTFRISGNGSFFFGRGGAGGPSSDSYGTSFSNVLYGYYTYVSAPTAPLTPGVTAPTTTSAAVTWAAPSDNGDSPITGYRVDYSTSNTFASNVTTVEVGNVLAYTVTGLTASTPYYFRILAENALTVAASTWGAPSTIVTQTSGAGGGALIGAIALQAAVSTTVTYPASSCGFWSFWMTQSVSSWYIRVATVGGFGGATLLMGVDPIVGFWAATSTRGIPVGDGPTYRPAGGFPGAHRFSVGVGAVFAAGVWTFPLTLYVDGVLTATGTSVGNTPSSALTNANKQPSALEAGTFGAVGSAVISRFEHTLTLAHEEFATQTTEAGYISAAAAATSQVALGTLPAGLSPAPVGYLVSSGQTTLDAMNLIAKTEQGYLDCVTAGTYINPVQSVRVRARQRPLAVAYSFDAQAEVSGTIDFIRDSTNLIWSDVVTGANSLKVTVSDLTLQTRAGSNNASDTVANSARSDLYYFGTDRLARGQNTQLRPVSVTINNLTCPTDRSSDLLQMAPGDRIQIYNIPSTTLGFSTFDGWLIDKAQSHRAGPNAEDKFTLYLQPATLQAVYDTDRFMAGGALSLSGSLTAGATTVQITAAAGAYGLFPNMIPNGSGESDASTWTFIPGVGGAGSVVSQYLGQYTEYGVRSIHASWTTAQTGGNGGLTTDPIAVTAGQQYSFGMYHVAPSISQSLLLVVDWYAGATYLSSSYASSTQFLANQELPMQFLGATAPATATFVKVKIINIAGANFQNWSVGSLLDIDGVIMQAGTALTPFGGTGAVLETIAFPYTLLIDKEQVTVTSCTPWVPQVATITRGVNGTTATTHAAGALIDVAPSALFAF